MEKMKIKIPSVVAYLWFVCCDALDSNSSLAWLIVNNRVMSDKFPVNTNANSWSCGVFNIHLQLSRDVNSEKYLLLYKEITHQLQTPQHGQQEEKDICGVESLKSAH